MGKVCGICKQEKPPTAFHKCKKHSSGLQYECKQCNAERKKTQRQADPLQSRRQAVRRYGITLLEYDRMLEKQGHVCAICSNPETKIVRGREAALAVDHCHETGKVRGLLCDRCNRGLGSFDDSSERLINASNYLKEHTND